MQRTNASRPAPVPWLFLRARARSLEHGVRAIRWRLRPAPAAPVRRGLALAAAALLACVRPSLAAFQNTAQSAQASAMGGSSLAALADPSGLFVAPASPAGLPRPELYFQYEQLNAGMSGASAIGQGFVAAGVPTRAGVLGLAVSDFRAAGLLEERVVAVGLARRLNDWLSAGVTGKYLYHDYIVGNDALAGADPVFQNGHSRGAPSFDAGVIASLTPALKLGFSARNLNSPDVGLGGPDRVPREYQAGASYEWKDWGLRTVADVAYRDLRESSPDARLVASVGLEKSFDERVRFRAGVGSDQISAGVGVSLGNFGFDYAFIIARALATASAGTHQIGIRYRFGGTPQ